MNRMADTVIRNMDDKQRQEEDKIRRYETEKEMRERLEDERRFRKMKDEQNRMRDFLNKQMQEKKGREHLEKNLNDEQAYMWKQDQSNYHEEEKRLNNKINQINKENAEFLKKQMEDKQRKERAKMNKQEFLLNKPLLKEINEKKRHTQYGGSNASKNGDHSEYNYWSLTLTISYKLDINLKLLPTLF